MIVKPLGTVLATFCVAVMAATGPVAAQALDIVGFGDSLMAGYQLDRSDAFPNQLEAALQAEGYAVEIANAGVSGDTTAAGLARLDWSVPEGTDLVIIELGANDALRGIDPATTEANLDAILTRLDERGVPVVLAGMLSPPNMGGNYAERFNAIFPALAEKHGVLAYYPFFLDGVAADESLNLEDGMHPTAEGVAVMVERFLPVMRTALDELRPS